VETFLTVWRIARSNEKNKKTIDDVVYYVAA
jgi:hypothetical protein